MAKTSARVRTDFRCTECGWTAPKWVGRCGECQQWGSVVELGAAKLAQVNAGPVSAPARLIGDIDLTDATHWSTGLDELDRVLGGGFVPGAVHLLAGEPGVGKSTLLLEVAARAASPTRRALYVTAEESTAQVRLRAERIGALNEHLYLAAETDLSAVLGQIDATSPDLLVLDSVQTVGTALIDGSPGGVAQVREVAAALIRVAKERNIAVVLVGHVTKDGQIAGPRLLEHIVDVVLYVDGERHARLRLIRAVKNRYGPADEIGCFELTDAGVLGIADPSGLFISRNGNEASGTCVTVALEGSRPLLAEVQALVAPTKSAMPRRATSGLESSRVAMILAVLERRCRVVVSEADVYAATVGGVRLNEPAADLALALAVASAKADIALGPRTIAFGEVGLAGEVRRVTGTARRLSEAARLGFTTAIVPRDSGPAPEGLRLVEVPDVLAAISADVRRIRPV
jgi:DNA repair protein RadA/Sms